MPGYPRHTCIPKTKQITLVSVQCAQSTLTIPPPTQIPPHTMSPAEAKCAESHPIALPGPLPCPFHARPSTSRSARLACPSEPSNTSWPSKGTSPLIASPWHGHGSPHQQPCRSAMFDNAPVNTRIKTPQSWFGHNRPRRLSSYAYNQRLEIAVQVIAA